jgi:hypothetical protein
LSFFLSAACFLELFTSFFHSSTPSVHRDASTRDQDWR